MTDMTESITFPQTTYAGGKYVFILLKILTMCQILFVEYLRLEINYFETIYLKIGIKYTQDIPVSSKVSFSD